MTDFVEVIGTENVANMIENSNLPRFAIQRKGSHAGTTPIFECLHTNTPKTAANEFKRWSSVILQGNPHNNLVYDIICFDGSPEDEPQTKRSRGNRVRFSFQLSNPFGGHQMGTLNGNNMIQAPSYSPEEIERRINDGINRAKLEWENKELQKRVKELEEELDEVDEDSLGHPFLDVLYENMKDKDGKINFGKKKKKKEEEEEEEEEEAEAVLNDIPDIKDAKQKAYLKRITNVLKRLSSADKNLLAHLEKLADIAEKKPATFNMILEQLDNF